MKNERVLIADDMEIALESVSKGIELFGEGHRVGGTADSVEEGRALIEGGLRPTVALVNRQFPMKGDGQRAAAIIKELSPETKIISCSSDSGLEWGEENWYKGMSLQELVHALTNLQH